MVKQTSLNASDNLQRELQELISSITGRSPEELRPDANFWSDLGIDSIKAVEIAVAIERRYKVNIRDEQIPKITNISQAVDAVRAALKNKNK